MEAWTAMQRGKASQFVTECIPKLGEWIDAPNIHVSGREKRDQCQMLVKEHVGVAINRHAATRIEFQGQMAKLQVIQRSEIVMSNVIEANHGLKNDHAALGKASLNGGFGIVDSDWGRSRLLQSNDGLARLSKRDWVSRKFRVPANDGTDALAVVKQPWTVGDTEG
jgi:hypothetical protein